jgi:hypothetical protein
MVSGANAFEISDIERMNIGAHQSAAQDVTMLSAPFVAQNNNSPATGRNRSDRPKPLGARRHARRDRLGRHRRHSATEPSVCPGPDFSTRSCARSHRATKCHAEVQHLLITSDHFLTPHSQLLAQPLRATHVWIAALIEAQESMYIAGQADTHAFANATGRLRGNTQPKRAVGTQI